MKNTKWTATLLAAALTVSLVGCGSAATTSSAATVEAASESASAAEATPTPEPTAEPTPEPTEEPAQKTSIAAATPRPEPVWITSHASADFDLEDLKYVNSAAHQTTPGDGKAFRTTMTCYNYVQGETGAPNGEVESVPYYDASIYSWYDADGTLHWYRDGQGTVSNALLEIDPNGDYGKAYFQSLDGSVSRGYYPTTEAMAQVLDSNGKNIFLSDYTQASYVESNNLDTSSNFYQDYQQYFEGATYKTSIQGESVYGMYVYMDDNMNIISMVYQLFGGAQNKRGYYPLLQFYTQEVMDSHPDTSAVISAFDSYDTVDCTVVLKDRTYTMPMNTACVSYLSLYNDEQTIEVSPAVEAYDKDGNSVGMQTELTSGQRFVLAEPVTFTIR